MPHQTGGPILFYSEGVHTATLLPDGKLHVKEPGGAGVTVYPDWRAFLDEIDPGMAKAAPDAERLQALSTLLGTPKTPDGQVIAVTAAAPEPAAPPTAAPAPRHRRGRPPTKMPVQQAAMAMAAAPEATPEAAPETATETAPEPQPDEQAALAREQADVRRVILRHGMAAVLHGIVMTLDGFDREMRGLGLARTRVAERTRQASANIAAAISVLPEDL